MNNLSPTRFGGDITNVVNLLGKWRTGNDYSNFDDIWRSSSDAVKPGVRMDPAMSISGGKYLTASVRISVGRHASISLNKYV